MNQKSFCTLFPDASNVHLVKDVGQIPYTMGKHYGYHSFLAAYGRKKDYPYLASEVSGLDYCEVRRGRVWKGIDTGVLRFLISQSRKIDVLNLYHRTTATKLYSILYRLLNRKGFIYIKLDVNVEHEKEYEDFPKRGTLGRFARQLLNRLFAASLNVASVETNEAVQFVAKNAPHLGSKLLVIPNGVDTEHLFHQCPAPSYKEKENLIITVGRLGTYEKNTEMLLQCLAAVSLDGWEVCLIGPVEPKFQPVIDEFYKLYPHLRDKVKFIGSISDRKELASWYSRAKIFLLTSRHEGFPLVFPEALVYGNYIITTDVSSARAVTENGKFGQVLAIDDVVGLSQALKKITSTNYYDEKLHRRITEHSQSAYSWNFILMRLNMIIQTGRSSC